jgi:hypothetical protein
MRMRLRLPFPVLSCSIPVRSRRGERLGRAVRRTDGQGRSLEMERRRAPGQKIRIDGQRRGGDHPGPSFPLEPKQPWNLPDLEHFLSSPNQYNGSPFGVMASSTIWDPYPAYMPAKTPQKKRRTIANRPNQIFSNSVVACSERVE